MDPAMSAQDPVQLAPWSTPDRRGSIGRRHKRMSDARECSLPVIVESEEKTRTAEKSRHISLPKPDKRSIENMILEEKFKKLSDVSEVEFDARVKDTVVDDADKVNGVLTNSKADVKPEHVDDTVVQKAELVNSGAHDQVDNAATEEPSVTLPKLRCPQTVVTWRSATAEELRKATRLKTGRDTSEAAVTSGPTDVNDNLLNVVYPHAFYDRYSRSGRRTCEPRVNKEVFTICKSAKVSIKLGMRTNSPMDIPVQPDPSSSYIGAAIRVGSHLDTSGKSGRAAHRTNKKTVHVQCRPKNAQFITEMQKDQRLFIKGLRGWILRKDDATKISPREAKRSEYHINSLGMQFSIPEYNRCLPTRHAQSSLQRPLTVLQSPAASPRLPAPDFRPDHRPYTHVASPRHGQLQLSIQSMSRNTPRIAKAGTITRVPAYMSAVPTHTAETIPRASSDSHNKRANTISVESMKALMVQIANTEQSAGRTAPASARRALQALALPPLNTSGTTGITSMGRIAS